MKRTGNLFAQVTTFENLTWAVRRVVRGKKSKNSVARFYLDFEDEIIALQSELESDSYVPRPYHEFQIFEPKERKICSSDVRDRVVHHAVCRIIDPYLERRLIYDTYACRVGKGTHRALRRCQQFSRTYRYFLKCDISKYFESVDHSALKRLLERIFKDDRILKLLGRIIDHSVPGAPPDKGLPIGNLTSQHFANLYLGELDHFVKEKLKTPGYLRYMDDFILFHDSKEFLLDALDQVRAFVEYRLVLKLKDSATILAPVSEGVPFLGFRVFPQLIRIQRKNLIRMRRKIVRKEKMLLQGKISEEDLSLSVSSMLAHAAHANSKTLLRKEVLKSLRMA